ncbi:MAG TPA: ferrous iron transporter B, partial [Methanocorpusculum sp.]|nr:ferrous iron transporter B [Methanocorpusculum sp.]
VGIALRHTVFKAGKTEFVLELPPYRLPTIKGVLLHTWNNAKEFLVRAGTIIFAACLVVWLLASLPFGVEYGSLDSVLGMIGSSIAPIFEPLGFGFAEAAVAIIMGLLAKEVVVGTFGTLFGVGEEALGDVLINLFTPLSSVSFMVFVLLYVPCLAALFTIKKESGSWKFTIFAAVLMLVVAWIVSFIVYQGGLLLGF